MTVMAILTLMLTIMSSQDPNVRWRRRRQRRQRLGFQQQDSKGRRRGLSTIYEIAGESEAPVSIFLRDDGLNLEA